MACETGSSWIGLCHLGLTVLLTQCPSMVSTLGFYVCRALYTDCWYLLLYWSCLSTPHPVLSYLLFILRYSAHHWCVEEFLFTLKLCFWGMLLGVLALRFQCTLLSPKWLWNCLLSPVPRFTVVKGLCWQSLRICVYNRIPGDAVVWGWLFRVWINT